MKRASWGCQSAQRARIISATSPNTKRATAKRIARFSGFKSAPRYRLHPNPPLDGLRCYHPICRRDISHKCTPVEPGKQAFLRSAEEKQYLPTDAPLLRGETHGGVGAACRPGNSLPRYQYLKLALLCRSGQCIRAERLTLKIAVVGSGNGSYAAAADFGLKGHRVRMVPGRPTEHTNFWKQGLSPEQAWDCKERLY